MNVSVHRQRVMTHQVTYRSLFQIYGLKSLPFKSLKLLTYQDYSEQMCYKTLQDH